MAVDGPLKSVLVSCLLALLAGPAAFHVHADERPEAAEDGADHVMGPVEPTEPVELIEPADLAEPVESAESDDDDSGMLQSIYEGQEAISRTVRTMSQRMDRMFGTTEGFPDEAYDSVLRLRFIQRIDEGGGGELEANAGGKLSLPGTQERLSLVFLTDDFDDPLDRERRTEREIEENTRQSLALRLFRPSDRWKTAISAGLRSGDPIDLLMRLSLWRDFEPGSWHIRPSQSIFWYDERGAGGRTGFRVEHPLGATMLLRSDSSSTWFQREETFYYDQVFSLLQPIGRRRDLLWQVGLQAESQPNDHVTRYYAHVRWRSVVHRDWLVLELRPQILRDRENAFRTQLRLFLGFELLFGDPRSY